jgi:DNA-binding NtrC family response regulator
MHILIADADEETRLVLAEAITAVDPDATVAEVRDGTGLRRALAGRPPDIVFADTVLPETDGAAVLTWRQGPGAASVLVLVADLPTPSWPTIARRLDAYDVLLKPLGTQNVSRVLQAASLLSRQLSLLLVEPNARTRQLAWSALDRATFRFVVTEAADGAAAVRAAKRQSYDLVLIDTALPDISALEASCRIDALGTGARIVLAGPPETAPTPGQLSLFGACAFLPMPFTAAHVDGMVYDAFGLWRPYVLTALRQEEVRRAATGRPVIAGLGAGVPA